MKIILSSIQGLIMGIAELIPGVSGSNFAIIMGIYDDFIKFLDDVATLLTTLASLVLRKMNWRDYKSMITKVNWGFGIPIIVGMFLASASFSNLVTQLLIDHANLVYSLFFGLIIASISVPFAEIQNKKSLKNIFIIIISAILFFIFFSLRPASFGAEPPIILLFVAGFVGVVGNVLPGISGPFLLLMIGLYDFIIALLASVTTLRFDAEMIQKFLIFFAGQILGLVIFVKIIKFILDKYSDVLMSLMTGLMIASLRITYPFFEGSSDDRSYTSPFNFELTELLFMIFLIIAGIGVVYFVGKMGVDKRIAN